MLLNYPLKRDSTFIHLCRPSIANVHVITSPLIKNSKSPSAAPAAVMPAAITAAASFSSSSHSQGLPNIKTRRGSSFSRSPSPPGITSPLSETGELHIAYAFLTPVNLY